MSRKDIKVTFLNTLFDVQPKVKNLENHTPEKFGKHINFLGTLIIENDVESLLKILISLLSVIGDFSSVMR